ncbi:MAG: lipoate--protein ligase family protein [Cyanobacteria bacterium RYN_339]|nr:lipoate--protein ligase family protein [Cyanobacteria bacterium RYN_339]
MIGRLLDTGPGDGAWNMAVDEAMLEGLRLGLAPPTLRAYAWQRPTVSLGRAQLLDPDLEAACASAGVAIVRRPTGGRAVLHTGDFTYAITATDLPAGVKASYCHLAHGLTAGLAGLGVTTTLGEASRPGRSVACFASPTAADLKAGAAKLLGSAQMRRAGAVLQHGTLYLERPTALARQLFPDGEGDVADLLGLLGRMPSWREVRDGLAQGLGEALGLTWQPGPLTPWEAERAAASRMDFALKST